MMETPECQMLFFELSPEELTILAALLALSLYKSLSLDQTNVLGNFLAAVGTLMTAIVAEKQVLDAQNQPQIDVQKQIKELQDQMQKILNKE